MNSKNYRTLYAWLSLLLGGIIFFWSFENGFSLWILNLSFIMLLAIGATLIIRPNLVYSSILIIINLLIFLFYLMGGLTTILFDTFLGLLFLVPSIAALIVGLIYFIKKNKEKNDLLSKPMPNGASNFYMSSILKLFDHASESWFNITRIISITINFILLVLGIVFGLNQFLQALDELSYNSGTSIEQRLVFGLLTMVLTPLVVFYLHVVSMLFLNYLYNIQQIKNHSQNQLSMLKEIHETLKSKGK